MSSWTVFRDKGKTAQGHRPSVSFHRGGRLSLNQAAFDVLHHPTHVELLFDEGARRMGFRAVSPTERHAYSVTQPTGSSRYYISAASFGKHYGIEPDKTYEEEASLEGDVLACPVRGASAAGVPTAVSPAHQPDTSVDADEFAATPKPVLDPDPDEEFGVSRSGGMAPSPDTQDIDPDDIPF
jgi:hypothetical protein